METLNLTVNRGCTLGPIYIYPKDENGSAVSLAGYSAFAHVRKMPSGDLLLDLSPSVESQRIVIPEITDEASILLENVVAAWDCILQDSLGRRLPPLIGGNFVIKTPTTQP